MTKMELTHDAFMYVVRNWAVGTPDVAKALKVEPVEARRVLTVLKNKGLLDSLHVNGDPSVTWQSDYDIQNEEDVEPRAERQFAETFGLEVPAVEPTRHHSGVGSRYTESVLQRGVELRTAGLPWSDVARQAAGTAASYHFSQAVRKFHGSDPKADVSRPGKVRFDLDPDELEALRQMLAEFDDLGHSEDDPERRVIKLFGKP